LGRPVNGSFNERRKAADNLKKPVTLRLYQRSQTASALRTAACDPFIFRLPILVFKTEQSLKSWLFAIVIAGMNQ
jgi:hypothetical protein